jgi:2-polyprenyl-3-methyl-5-hydroxy-6-metoxy-1,4-benzoquinol methylase
MSTEQGDLPATISCTWGGPPLTRKFSISRVLTQRSNQPFAIYWSEKHDYGRLHPTPTKEELFRFYDTENYAEYLNPELGERAAGNPQQSSRSLLDRLLARLAWGMDHGQEDPIPGIRRLAHGPGKTVCDIGCGSCTFLARMGAEGYALAGVDPNESARLAAAKQGVEFFHGTGESLPDALLQRKFDVVTMFHSLEHCSDPRTTLNNLSTLLADTGVACIEVPNHGCVGFEMYGPCWFHTDAGRHIFFFTKESLELALREAGLRAEHWEYSSYARQFGREWLATMQDVWDKKIYTGYVADFPRPTDSYRYKHFLRTVRASEVQRYEVIRVYARHAAT